DPFMTSRHHDRRPTPRPGRRHPVAGIRHLHRSRRLIVNDLFADAPPATPAPRKRSRSAAQLEIRALIDRAIQIGLRADDADELERLAGEFCRGSRAMMKKSRILTS